MKRFAIKFFSLVVALSLALGMIGQVFIPVEAVSTSIVISQIYGGGGNSGGVYTNDFVELFNLGPTTVSLAGWSIQYASATGTGNFAANSGQITPLSGSLAPGQYLLVQEAAGSNTWASLPTPDVTDDTPINMSGTGAKVALVNTTTPLGCNGSTTICSDAALATIIDLVGWDGANYYEGSGPAPATSNSTAILRKNNGCTDTDNNSADFVTGTPAPRNSASPLNECPLGDMAPSVSSTSPGMGSLDVPLSSDITITFSEAVDVADGWYDVTCSASGTHSALVSGASDTYTINPDADFSEGEVCTVTLTAAKITDQDLLDPGYAMLADYRFGFTTYVDVCSSYTPTYEIQGSGSSAAITGTVRTNGVVVGDFQNNTSIDNGNLNGFHIQDPTGDGNPLTSDGIFIYKGSIDVVLGDRVSVTGSVSEYNGLTEITASNIVVCSSGETVAPTPISLPVISVDAFESYEGMLVTFPQDLIISEYFNYDRYGEIVLTSTRHMTPTALYEPGSSEAAAAAQQFLLDRITLDDGRSAQNPDPAIHPNGNVFDLTNLFRGGDIVQNVTGVLDYSNNLYRLQPTQGSGYIAANTRPDVPPEVGGTLKVVSMNTLNYFSTIDTGADNCGPLGDQECRGADTVAEFLRQHDKLVAAISTMNPDVAGLIEIENNVNDEALQKLVDGLNGLMGAGTYDYIHTGTIGTDAIKVALIYKPASVSLVGDYAILDSSVDPRFLDDYNRPVLAQSFRDANGGVFTVAVNHLKSKGSACVNDPDLGDGAGNCNLTRQTAAQALVDWLDTVPTGSGDKDVMIIGDLNSYDKEDPIDAILAGPDDILGTFDDYVDMTFLNEGEHAYSYVFDGQIGYLDFAMTATLADQVTGTTTWHVNADEPDLIDYEMTFKADAQDAIYAPDFYRYSDHDPVIIGLALIPTYEFTGFTKPVENLPEVNKVNAGANIPIKFSLSGDWGMEIFEYEVPLVVETACEFTQEPVDLSKVSYIDRSKLLYDSKEDQYIYNWTTSKEWSGSCQMLTIVLNDGSIHQAAFSFK
jgi:hypothetical protein